MAVEEMKYGDVDIDKLQYALQGLNSFFLALVWEFAEYCLRLQSSLEQWDRAKRD